MANRRPALEFQEQERRSERRQLMFQLQYVTKAIKDLKQVMKAEDRKAGRRPAVSGSKAGPGRPKKAPMAGDGQPLKRGPGRPRKDGLPPGSVPKRTARQKARRS